MTREQLVNRHNYLYVMYKGKMNICFEDLAKDDFGSYIRSRKIVLPKYIKTNPTEWSLFAFLHEIGHIETNTPNMKRYEMEYLATQWAISEARRIGFNVQDWILDTYQNYIWRWRETSLKHKGKNVASKQELTLRRAV